MSASSSHTERTAAQPRHAALHAATLVSICQINPRIRLLKLGLPYAIPFLPGQWLDLHIPTLPTPGGFSITSTPRAASASARTPHLELAVQRAPGNPPAAWLWRPEAEILGRELGVRVGGGFVWPPAPAEIWGAGAGAGRLVLVAGGVGINPLISILSHLHETDAMPPAVRLLYATKTPGTGLGLGEVLFWPRLRRIFEREGDGEGEDGDRRMNRTVDRSVDLFLSPAESEMGEGASPAGASPAGADPNGDGNEIRIHQRRLGRADLEAALGPVGQRAGAVAYVCGPAGMTDEVVRVLGGAQGMGMGVGAGNGDGDGDGNGRVRCERWW